MKIVVGGQIDKENVNNLLKKYIPESEIIIKSDIDAAMDVKAGNADYYFGACNTGGGGALAMAIAIIGADKCATLAMPGNILDEEKIKEEVNSGKIAFGFTPQAAEQVIKTVAEYIK
ncbi:DUF2620 domain-containing protein [Pseudoleptotrichia goodfellowii]|jgi:putative inner membrane protein|uniref:DUF2620 domain-containing protein n=1 Tax=Pseudoleptotrichia goodfellowii F0264 TaxID=596323 RepID=D0GNT2_9FUSO|nr:DUF2620 domain-containing protein [Pseudoleptotrichia goodfellowii]EEY34227.1 hypothetical protein HMPREF0554_2365 [Pseudoleptotrichia goodfellowii F0264]